MASYLGDVEKFPENSHLLGDSAYSLHENLLVPYRDDGHLRERKKNYNYRHASARVAVERCIGLLKGRMRSLLHCLPMSRVDLMAHYIVACCVVHNICTMRGDEIFVITLPGQPHAENVARERDDLPQQGPNPGINKRNFIKDSLR